jgi:hypothetical protein
MRMGNDETHTHTHTHTCTCTIAFTQLHGKFPFKGKTNKDIYRAIKAGKYALSPTLSAEAADFLEQLLQQESLARMSVDEVRRAVYVLACTYRSYSSDLCVCVCLSL